MRSYKSGSLVFLLLWLHACTFNSLSSSPSNSSAPNRLEPFDRNADYEYDLQSLPRATSYDIDLGADGFAWPRIVGEADTAFLEIHVQSSSSPDPAIGIQAGEVAFVQYFEQGGQGKRYLDVSPLLGAGLSAGTMVQLLDQGAQWIGSTTTLVTFDNPPMEDRRVLVVAPHPDDAEIAAYGIYKAANADVVTVTSGDAGGRNFERLWADDGAHYRAKGRIRTLDSLVVPLLSGMSHESVRNLGYYDATLRSLWERKPETVAPPLAVLEDPAYYRQFNFDAELREREFESSWPALVADLLKELERVNPESIVAPHPMLDRHGDHKFAALALFEAIAQWQGEAEILLYTNHAVGNEAYPLGPRDGMMGLPAWNQGNLYFRGLYSHPMSEEDRRRKLIALESMHDLRPFDARDGSEIVAIDPLFDYFRRGPRPNEVFFVTDTAGVREMHRTLMQLAEFFL